MIGKETLCVSEEDAMDHVAGFTVGNDVTHYGWMKKGDMRGAIGKHFNGFGPIGPAIVSKEVLPDYNKANIWCKINGEVIQNANTTDMIFSVEQLVSFLSQGTTLYPGDIIFTGT